MTVMPCQCGAKHAPAIHERIREHAGHYPSAWHVYCEVCGLRAPTRYSLDDAIRAWNRLALAVQIADAAWLEREAEYAGYTSAAKGELVSCASDELHRLLTQWGDDVAP